MVNRGVPANLKCNVCKKVKPSATTFSNKQKDILQAHMAKNSSFNPTRDAYAVCTSCTSQQVIELQCYYCDKTKGLDRFPLAQRKKPDTAECWKCQKERLDIEPDSESDSQPSGGEGSDDSYGGDDDYNLSSASGGASLHTDMDQLSMSNASRGPGTYASNLSTGGSSSTGGVPLSRASQSVGTASSAASTRTPPSTKGSGTPSISSSNRTITPNRGFNPNAYTNPARRAPSSKAGSSRSSPFNSESGGGKFAKIKAVKQKVRYDMAEQEDQEEKQKHGKQVDSDDEVVVAKDSDSEDE